MWLSSFATSGAPELHAVRARVWNGRGSDATFPKEENEVADAQTLVVTSDVSLLRRLRVFHDSFVTLQYQERRHVARLRIVPHSIQTSSQDSTTDESHNAHQDVDVTLSPLLAFNLGLHTQATVSVRPISSSLRIYCIHYTLYTVQSFIQGHVVCLVAVDLFCVSSRAGDFAAAVAIFVPAETPRATGCSPDGHHCTTFSFESLVSFARATPAAE